MSADWPALIRQHLDAGAADPGARLAQLATVRTDGAPAVRTVVFRGFAPGDGLRFTADLRSAKIKHLAHDARAELAWYFTAPRTQFRVAGEVQVVDADAPEPAAGWRAAVWRRLSDPVRAGFSGDVPGRPLTDGDPPKAAPADGPPPSTFALLVLWPERVDHVELAPWPHRRTLYARDTAGRWHARPVNP